MKIAEFRITEHKFDMYVGLDEITYCYIGAFDTIAELLQFIKENRADGNAIMVIGITNIDYTVDVWDSEDITFEIIDNFYKRLMNCPACE